ncbi:MAG TPA: anti-sigma regulatory factor [Gemmataceae bacterium]|jgi:serine/threonine-protein kinase RsbT
MPVLKHESMPIRSESDIVLARQLARKWSAELGFSLVDQTKIVTATSELARNTLIHGGGGAVRLESLSEGARKGLRLTFEDQGPGIANIELAMRDGYTTGNGLGLGLSGSKRLMSEFDLMSRVGEGTRVTVVKWK